MTPEMHAMIGGAADFQRAFREVWFMPYVVVPPPSGRRLRAWMDAQGYDE